MLRLIQISFCVFSFLLVFHETRENRMGLKSLELQIREGILDNLEAIFLISEQKIL